MTKRTLVVLGILAMLAVPAFAANSLVSAGSLMLAGGSNFAFDYASYTYKVDVEGAESTTATDMGVGLFGKLGYFVIDSLAVGPILNIGYTQHSYDPDSDLDPTTEMTYGGGVWAGYYFDLGSAFYPYASLGFLFQGMSFDDPNANAGDGATTTGSEYGPELMVGALVNFIENWSLDLGLKVDYLMGTSTYSNSDSVDTDITTLDIGLNVGLAVFF